MNSFQDSYLTRLCSGRFFSGRSCSDRICSGFALLTIVLGLCIGSCSGQTVHAEKSPAADSGPAGPDEIIAQVGDIDITIEEVESVMAGQLLKVDQQRQEILENGLEGLISQKLMEVEADQNDLTVEALIQQQVDAKVTAPTEAEVDAFYEQRKASIEQPKEEVAAQIVQYLRSQKRQDLAASYVSELRQKHTVRSFLEPIRIEVSAEGSPSFGPEDAPVTIVEFSDFQCPFCSRVLPTFDAVRKNYGDQVRLVFRQFPLSNIHPQAQKAAEASLFVVVQGKFWYMHDQMFGNQGNLAVPQLKETAAEMGLEAAAFDECLDSGKYADQVRADLVAGGQAGVTGTPAMFINGRFLSGAQPYARVAGIIDDELSRLSRSTN